MKRLFLRTVLFCLIFAMVLSVPASAVGTMKETGDMPYSTFTYWDHASNSKPVIAKGMYDLEMVYEAKDLYPEGLYVKDVSKVQDICFDKRDNAYVLDSGTGLVLVYDATMAHQYTINGITDENGELLDFVGATRVFVSVADKLYICDTEHHRVLIADLQGKLIDTLLLPDSKLIPEDLSSNYRPSSITVDSSEYVYVLADGSYYGAVMYSPAGEFLGFFGANTVASSVTQVIKNLWNKLTMTNEKYAQLSQKLPFQFTDLYVDGKDFVYTVTGATTWGVQTGQLKRMSPGGADILKATDVTFGLRDAMTKLNKNTYSDLAGLAANDDGYVFLYDRNSGYIFVYDDDCVLLNAFGGGSAGDHTQKQVPVHFNGIDVSSNNDLLVADSLGNAVFSYKLNDYGRLVFEADTMTRLGDYEVARPLWEEVLTYDRNSQIAYSGIARTYFASGDYDLSMKYARMGFDYDTYSSAFEYVRRAFLEKNINWLAGLLVLIIVGLVLLNSWKKKKGIVFVKNANLSHLTRVMLHPADVFADIKQKNMGSALIGTVLIILYYVTATIKETESGFLFRSPTTSGFNSLLVLLQTGGLVLLWTICNWAVCTLMSGKGKLREIYIVTSYSLVPLIISNIVYTVLSNCLISDESAFLGIFTTIMQIFMAYILIMGMIRIHDYTFGEFVGTSILSALGILIVIFLMIAVFILVQQTYSFLATIFREIFYR